MATFGITKRRTVAVNPAPAKAKRKRVLTPAQLRFFGTKAQKARAGIAAKPKRRVTAKKSNPVRSTVRHRRATRSNPGDIITLALNPAPARRTTRKTKTGELKMAIRKRRKTTRRATSKRRNPVSAPRRRRRATRRRNPALSMAPRRRRSTRRRNPSTVTRRRRSYRRNPGLSSVSPFLKQAAFVIAGAVGSKMLAQAVLAENNKGYVGYAANIGAGFALGMGVNYFMKDKSAGNAVILGSVVQTLIRFLSDKTPYGARLAELGVGDYMAQNFLTPQRVVNGLHSAQLEAPVMQMPAAAGLKGLRRSLY